MENNERVVHEIVGDLLESYKKHAKTIKTDTERPINRTIVIEIFEKLRMALFPGFFGDKRLRADTLEFFTGDVIEYVSYHLSKQIARALDRRRDKGSDIYCEANGLTYKFLKSLPNVRALLSSDVDASYDGDPAAFSADEVVLSYPGLYALTAYRIAHELHVLGVPLIPRMITEHAHGVTGIDIHPGASIGKRFFIDHGTGVVIGETTIIGENVKIYQGVTLGALSTRGGQLLKNVKRHPTIMNDVTIYAGASILGGGTVVESGVTVASNAFITKSVYKVIKE